MAALIRAGRVTTADLPLLRRTLAEVSQPATARQRLTLLEALFQHYPARNLGAGEKQFWLDWNEDAADLPVPVLAAACAKWRRSDQRFAPSPGQLLKLVDEGWTYRVKLLQSYVFAMERAEKGVDN